MRAELVEVVDHERGRLFERLEVRQELLHHRRPAEAGGGVDPLHDPARLGESPDQGQPEPLGVVLVALDRQPGDAVFKARRLDPRSGEHGLAAAGRGADERDAARSVRGEPLDEGVPTHEPPWARPAAVGTTRSAERTPALSGSPIF